FEVAKYDAANVAFGRVVDACRATYCVEVPGGPSLVCSRNPEGREEMARAWAEIWGLILVRDAGPDAPDVGLAFEHARQRIPKLPPPTSSGVITLTPPRPPGAQGLRALVDTEGLVTLTHDGKTLASMPLANLKAYLTEHEEIRRLA